MSPLHLLEFLVWGTLVLDSDDPNQANTLYTAQRKK